eukprot:s823_g13.t1
MRPAMAVDKDLQKVLTARFAYDWRGKTKDLGGGQSVQMSRRRARLVARDYAFQGGRRDDVYSPAGSTHLLRFLPCLYPERLAMVGENMTACPEDATILGCIDFQDAFLQVPQEQPLRLRIGGAEHIVLRNIPGQRVGARAWFDYVSKFLEEEFGLEFCALSPCLAKSDKRTALIHMDDMMILGSKGYLMNQFFPKVKEKFSTSMKIMENSGDKVSFLKRSYLRVADGLVVVPGNYINNMLELYESNFGAVRVQKVPADASIQVEDNSPELDVRAASIYMSLVGMLIYLSQGRVDVGFVTKELASKMAKPTKLAMSREQSPPKIYIISGPCFEWQRALYNIEDSASRFSLSSAEAELHSLVSAAADGVYIRECLFFLTGLFVKHSILVGNTAAKTIAVKRGCGRIRHINGKLLWIQRKTKSGDLDVVQVNTTLNVADAGTKQLSSSRLRGLLFMLGVVCGEYVEAIGEAEFQQMTEEVEYGKRVKVLAKAILRLYLLGEIPLATGVSSFPLRITDENLDDKQCFAEDTTSLSTRSSSGFAFTSVLAISAVFLALVYIFFKV